MNWSPEKVILALLSSTVPLCVIGIIVMRIITNQPLSENASLVLMAVLTNVGSGVVRTLDRMLNKNEDKQEGK